MINEQKAWKRFLYGESIERCSAEVCIKNNKNLRAFATLGIIMMSFAVVFGWMMSSIFTFNFEFLLMWGYFLIMRLTLHFVKINSKYVTLAFYLWLNPIMVMGIILGTFGDPTQPSITIMVFLCVLPMFILDKPWRVILFIILNAAVYTWCCYEAKTFILFAADMIDLILFTVLGVGVNCLILRDRIDNVEYAMKMRLIAETDALTGIYNRRAGEERIRSMIDHDTNGMFLLIDFDNFKDVNDTYGHTIGDICLKIMGECLEESFGSDDIVMRFGGDEFAVFMQNLKSENEGQTNIERLIDKVHNITIPEMPNYRISVSIGVSFSKLKDKKTFETVYRESDEALYQAKANGKDTYYIFKE